MVSIFLAEERACNFALETSLSRAGSAVIPLQTKEFGQITLKSCLSVLAPLTTYGAVPSCSSAAIQLAEDRVLPAPHQHL